MDCIEFPKADRCDVTEAGLHARLYDHWKRANRTDVPWADPNTPLPIINALQEGAYPLPSSSQLTGANATVAYRDHYLVAASDVTVNDFVSL